MLRDIVFVEPLDGYFLRLRFEDGVEGVVDVSEIVALDGVFAALRNKAVFDKVRLNPELGTVEWEVGADLDPVVLYAKVTGQPIPDYAPGVHTP